MLFFKKDFVNFSLNLMLTIEFHRMRIINKLLWSQQNPCTFLGRKIIKALLIGKDQVHEYMRSSGNPPKSTDGQAFLWTHPCLQKTHQRLSSLVCEAFIQNRSKFGVKRWGLCGPSPSLWRNYMQTKIKAN